MEPESPSPYPQVPATCPYPEPTPSSHHDPLQLPQDPFYYYPPIYVLVSPMASYPQVSAPKPCIHLSFPPPTHATCTAYLMLDLITRIIFGEDRRTSSHFVFSSTPLLFLPSWPKRPPHTPCFSTPPHPTLQQKATTPSFPILVSLYTKRNPIHHTAAICPNCRRTIPSIHTPH